MRRLIDPIELKRSIAVSNMIGDGKTLEELIDEQPDAQTNAESTQDLISRQALCEYALNQKNKSVTPNDIMRFPSAQPEIIRCKDCRKNPNWEWVGCPMTGKSTRKPDDFCSYAERKTDDKADKGTSR